MYGGFDQDLGLTWTQAWTLILGQRLYIWCPKYGYPVYGVLQLNIIKEKCTTEVAHGVVAYVKMLWS